MQFHPYAEKFPRLSGPKYERLKKDIKETHGPLEPVKYRLLPDGTKQYIDGLTRIKICQELGIDWSEVEIRVSDDDVEDYIDSLNIMRRHMTPSEEDEFLLARRERVAVAREDGKSFAQIAEEEGISRSMAYRDAASTVPRGTVENEETESKPKDTVVGLDGKERKKSTRKLCPACTHRQEVGKPLIEKCEDCKSLNAKKPKEKPVPATVEEEEPDEVLDDEGTMVPAKLRAVFQATGLFRSAALAVAKAAISLDKVETTLAYAAMDKASNNAKEGDRRVYSTACRTAENKMNAWRPAIVCKDCSGDCCDACGNKGFLTVGEVKDGI